MSRPDPYRRTLPKRESEDLNLFYDLVAIGVITLPIVFAFVLGYHWGQR